MDGGCISRILCMLPGTNSSILRAFEAGWCNSTSIRMAASLLIRICLCTSEVFGPTRFGSRVETLRQTSIVIHNSLSMICAWPWVVLALLGAYHGLNPAMGWLFAMAIGLQQKSRSAIVRALVPIAIGHAVAIALAILVLRSIQDIFPPRILKLIVAAVLFLLGGYRIFRASHPRGAGMR